MHDQIGSTAGSIWHALNEKGELSITQLKRIVKGDKTVFDWAIGWLAREDKIVITPGKARFACVSAATRHDPPRLRQAAGAGVLLPR